MLRFPKVALHLRYAWLVCYATKVRYASYADKEYIYVRTQRLLPKQATLLHSS